MEGVETPYHVHFPPNFEETCSFRMRSPSADVSFLETLEFADCSRTLSNLLPSRTLYHKKKSSVNPVPSSISRSVTLPRHFPSENRSLVNNEIRRHLSSACHRKKYIIDKRKAKRSAPTECLQIDSESNDLSEEDAVMEQLLILRGLPLPISEKREYKRTILQSAAVTAKGETIWHRQKEKAKGRVTESIKTFFNKLEIWSSSMKFIEGHFGTSVVSYFIFLRWLLFLNLCIFIAFFVFIVIPQAFFKVTALERKITVAPQIAILDSHFVNQFPVSSGNSPEKLARVHYVNNSRKNFDNVKSRDHINVGEVKDLGSLLDAYVVPQFLDASLYYGRSNHTVEDRLNTSELCFLKYINFVNKSTQYAISGVIQDFFQGTGWMELTLMFSGYYVPTDLHIIGTNIAYNLPVAFLTVLLALYIVCLIMMVNYASKGVRETLLSTESTVQSYCNMVFCAWDFCIENTKTATLKHNSIILELKSNLAEARRQALIAQWTTLHKIKIYLIRFLVNIFVISALVGTYYLIINVANYQLKEERMRKQEGFMELLVQFLPSITITALNFIMPIVFDILVQLESFGAQTAINITLLRAIFVRLASIVILVLTFHHQIKCEPKGICRDSLGYCPTLLCWETYVGQQMYKLVMLDFIVAIGVTLFWEVPRNFLVQKWRCKLTKILGRQTFDVPSQVLALVYSQTLCWLGMFYSPLLPTVCVIKTVFLFYIKKFTLIVNCVPSQMPYRASRSNAVFVIVLMLNFFITVAVLGYTVSNIEPSPGCSPFRYYNYMIDAIRDALNVWTPEFSNILKFIFSAGFAVPFMIILCLSGYYYLTVTSAHKHMIRELKSQLVLEGQDKQFLLNRLTEVACQGITR